MCNTIGNIFRLCIVGGVALALTMQFLATFSCEFVKTTDGSFGIWYIEDENGDCVEWDTDQGAATGAQTALTVATVAGFGAGAMVFFEWLLCEVCCAGCLEGLAFCAAWIMGGATYSIYAIDECGLADVTDANGVEGDCEWGTAATYMMVANVCYLVCGILLCCAPQPEPICKQGS